MTIIRIDDLTITVSEKRPDGSYSAWLGDYDLDCMEGWGKSVVTAASDLLDKHAEYLQDNWIWRIRSPLVSDWANIEFAASFER